MDTEVYTWDNTLSAREHISYIAEQSGTFVCIGRDGKLYFRKIGEDIIEYDKKYFKDMKWGNSFKISRIAYEDGVQDFKQGTVKDSTVWISQDNIYITEQEQIDNIYDYYKDFECFSFEGSTIIDPAVDVGDVLLIDGKRVIYQGEADFIGKFKANIKSNIKSKVKQESSIRKRSEKTSIRRLESKIDQVEGNITLLGEEVSEYNDKISEIEVSVNGINQKVENIADVTRETSGATRIKLENCMAGELQELHIYGNNTVFERVFPSKKLYPSKSLFPRGYGKIAFYNDISDQMISQQLEGYVSTIYNSYDGMRLIITKSTNYNKEINYIKVKPNTKYTVRIHSKLQEYEDFIIGAFSADFEDNLKNEDIIEFIANKTSSNISYNEGFIKDASITTLEITTGDTDEYLVIDCPNSNLKNITVSNIYQQIELTELKRGLRQHEDACDKLVLKNNKLQVIRRIGVDDEGNKYILENEIIENLRDLTVMLGKGTNYIEILNYVANIEAKYVVINEFTSHFATVVEMKTIIEQLADSINLTLIKKADKENIIAALNMAILKEKGEDVSEKEVEKSIIQIFANILEIDTDNLKLEKDGTMAIKKGKVGGFIMDQKTIFNDICDILYKVYSSEDKHYINTLLIPSTKYGKNFIIAGMECDENGNSNSWDLERANFTVTNDGKLYLNTINSSSKYKNEINGGKIVITNYTKSENNYEQDVQTVIGSSLVDSYYIIAGNGGTKGLCLHGRNLVDDYTCDWINPNLWFYVNGVCVGNVTISSSDKRLKKDIEEIPNNILELIDFIDIKKFRFKVFDKINFGIIAQELIDKARELKIDNLFEYSIISQQKVLMNDETLYYQINYEQFLILKSKCLEKQNKKQQMQLDFLINKLNCKEELENYMKGEKNA